MAEENKFLMYKNRPLVRCGDEILYGRMCDEYIVRMNITAKKDVDGLSVATRVNVQLLSTDESKRMKDRISKSVDKMGLSSALEIATIWLDRA